MVDGDNNESGFALLYALGAIVLSTLMIGTIFLLARTVFSQIETIDRFSRVQDVQEFALQQATNTIKKKINSELNIMKTVSLGSDEKKIKQSRTLHYNKVLQIYSLLGADTYERRQRTGPPDP